VLACSHGLAVLIGRARDSAICVEQFDDLPSNLEPTASIDEHERAQTPIFSGIFVANRRILLRRVLNLLPATMPARTLNLAGRHGAWRSLVAHLLWEHDAPFPNDTHIFTAINELRVFRFANRFDCGSICGPDDGMIEYAIHRDTLQRALRA